MSQTAAQHPAEQVPDQLILASASPRRRELLKQLGLRFRVEISDIDESTLANESPPDYVGRVAGAEADPLLLLRELAEQLGAVLWLRDLKEERIVYVSPAFEKVFGRTAQQLLASPRIWVEAIHPDDRERVLSAAMNEARLGEDAIEYRIVKPDGSVRRVRDRAYPIRNATGQIVRLAGVAEDITGQENARG